jgi:Tfp pilus assembly protein PilN
MSDCLGLYIEDNLIKYAKVSKEKDKLKVESFGIKFYENVIPAIRQIVEETYSYKTPISTNVSEEEYSYFDFIDLLSKSDMQKMIKTEFGAFCSEKGYNENVFETRHVFAENLEEKDKVRIIHVRDNKIEFNKRLKQLDGYRINNISPMPLTIPNLIDTNLEENCLIVNLEDKTTVTTIIKKKIYDVTVLDEGSREVLDKINIKENSYAKAFEVCKNTTIYTEEIQGITEEENKNLDDIMPTIYTILGKVQKILNDSKEEISKVYITGSLANVNNMDLYFESYLSKISCEILKPYFMQDLITSVGIKDYVEVNSAISLAIQGLGEGIKGINFKKPTLKDSLPSWLTVDISTKKNGKKQEFKIPEFLKDFKSKLSLVETFLISISVGAIVFAVGYGVYSNQIVENIKSETAKANETIATAEEQTALVEADITSLKTKKKEFESKTAELDTLTEKVSEKAKTKNSIPNLLNKIARDIPQTVQVVSIVNTDETHIAISVQAEEYEQIGIFKAKLIAMNVLTDVTSDTGTKQNGLVKVTIEGELP